MKVKKTQASKRRTTRSQSSIVQEYARNPKTEEYDHRKKALQLARVLLREARSQVYLSEAMNAATDDELGWALAYMQVGGRHLSYQVFCPRHTTGDKRFGIANEGTYPMRCYDNERIYSSWEECCHEKKIPCTKQCRKNLLVSPNYDIPQWTAAFMTLPALAGPRVPWRNLEMGFFAQNDHMSLLAGSGTRPEPEHYLTPVYKDSYGNPIDSLDMSQYTEIAFT
jgi:hypothetical protein